MYPVLPLELELEARATIGGSSLISVPGMVWWLFTRSEVDLDVFN